MLLQQLFSLAIFLLVYSSLMISAGVFSGKKNPGMFVFYTTLSNLLVGSYHGLLFFAGFAPQGGLYRALRTPALAMIIAVCIAVTGLIYHFMLVPHYKANRADFMQTDFWHYTNIAVHYAVPLLSFAAWVLFADKNVTVWAAVIWLALPICYTSFALLRGLSGRTINGKPDGDKYPYPFLDLDVLGWRGMGRNLVIYTAGFFALALVFVGLGKLLTAPGL